MKTLRPAVVGVLAAVVAFGGIQVVSAVTENKEVTVCANKKTGAMRYTTKGCKKSETKLVLNSTGATGAKGDTGATGAKGDTGAAGAAGAAGTSSIRITELSVCDGTDAGTTADELCKIGMTGPGGGPVFFIDYFDQYTSFCASGDCNYLEAAPADADDGFGAFTMGWCSNTSSLLNSGGWPNLAVGTGRALTTTADTTCTSGAVQAAVDYTAPAFNGVAKDDWWLPSLGELMAMMTNLSQSGTGGFSNVGYWSSTEKDTNNSFVQSFPGGQVNNSKSTTNQYRVRPARGF